MIELDEFRRARDHFFAHDPQSPLTARQRQNFSGLRYFPENPGLRLEVVVEPAAEKAPVEMQTSTGDVQVYTRAGRFQFDVNGQQAELTIYESPGGLFLPFVDALTGLETYPAGRYLEPEPLAGGRVLVDFNLAYNPYCAYNAQWSCPLPPFENRLKLPIRAGEQVFDDTH
ncbi:MAG: DUF1684 domain-containing protein [Chloroflexota bacterium]